MKKILLYCVPVLLFALTNCDNFLSEMPTRSTNDPIKKIAQLEGFLNNPAWNVSNPVAEYSIDDEDYSPEFYDAYTLLFNADRLQFFMMDAENIQNMSSDDFWSSNYRVIYRANLIIENVDKVEGDQQLKDQIKAEAHFLRAYYNWLLVNHYCLPYCEANLDEPGLPRKVSTSMEEDVTRTSLAATYALIESDIEEALKMKQVEKINSWRPCLASVNAFLSRYYLFKMDYDKVISVADYALQNKGTVVLKDYNTLGTVSSTNYPETGNAPAATWYKCEFQSFSYVPMFGPTLFKWQEIYFLDFCTSHFQSSWPGRGLVSMFDNDKFDDLRYKYFFFEYGNRRVGLETPQVYRFEVYYSSTGLHRGPSVQEVMLNKAEALARKSSPDVAGAMSLVNELRRHRLVAGATGTNLTATTKEEALRHILEERRRELPYSHRWWDIRRFAVNETQSDDVEVKRYFYPVEKGIADPTAQPREIVTMPVGSRKYAAPINMIEINASKGQLQQNTY